VGLAPKSWDCSHRRSATLVAVVLRGLLEATQFKEGVATGLRESHAGEEIVFDVELKMAFEFGRQLLVYVILMKQSSEAEQQGAYCSNGRHIHS